MDGSTTEDARPRLRLRVAAWDKQTSARGLRTDAEAAHLLNTSQSTISRIKAGQVEPGGRFVASALWHLPGARFDELFEVVVTRAAS